MIAEAPSVLYIHEPFSVTDAPSRGICNAKFKYWFTYITRENETTFYRPIRNMIELRYDLSGALKTYHSRKNIREIYREYQVFADHRLKGSTPLIKDPIAFFSSEWLAERFDMSVVMVIRHPAAFASSIKKLNWSHPFSHFLEQSSLMKNLLHPFIDEIRAYAAREHAILDQAILLWKLIHYNIIRYREKHKNWVFVRHEDISCDPVEGFQDLYKQLNLEFSERVKQVIEDYSSLTNPGESNAPVGSEISLQRNSASNLWNWKTRLTAPEIERIKGEVEDISKAFYTDEDW